MHTKYIAKCFVSSISFTILTFKTTKNKQTKQKQTKHFGCVSPDHRFVMDNLVSTLSSSRVGCQLKLTSSPSFLIPGNPSHLHNSSKPSLNLYLLPWNDVGFSLCFLPMPGLCSPVYFPKRVDRQQPGTAGSQLKSHNLAFFFLSLNCLIKHPCSGCNTS